MSEEVHRETATQPSINHLYPLFQDSAHTYPQNIAVIFCQEDGCEERVTYRELQCQARQVSAELERWCIGSSPSTRNIGNTSCTSHDQQNSSSSPSTRNIASMSCTSHAQQNSSSSPSTQNIASMSCTSHAQQNDIYNTAQTCKDDNKQSCSQNQEQDLSHVKNQDQIQIQSSTNKDQKQCVRQSENESLCKNPLKNHLNQYPSDSMKPRSDTGMVDRLGSDSGMVDRLGCDSRMVDSLGSETGMVDSLGSDSRSMEDRLVSDTLMGDRFGSDIGLKHRLVSDTGIEDKIESVLPAIIGILCSSGIEAIVAILACLEHHSYWYINPEYTRREIKVLCDKICPKIILVQEEYLNNIADVYVMKTLTSIQILNKSFKLVSFDSEKESSFLRQSSVKNLAYVIATSGTTGDPKCVYVPHTSIFPNIVDLVFRFNIGSEDCIFAAAPLTFDPSVVDMFMAFKAGARLLVPSRSLLRMPKYLVSTMIKVGVTVLQTTPTLLFSIGKERLQQSLFSSSSCLRVLALGGEVFPRRLNLIIGDAHHVIIFNLYGITEVSCWASVQQVTSSVSEPIAERNSSVINVREGYANGEEIYTEADIRKHCSEADIRKHCSLADSIGDMSKAIPTASSIYNTSSLLSTLSQPYGPSVLSDGIMGFQMQEITSVGSPLTSTEVLVLRENGSEVEEREVGEIFVGGQKRHCWVDDSTLNTVNNQPYSRSMDDNTSNTVNNQPYLRATGDQGIIINNFVYCLGRKDRSQVKRNGQKVSLEEIAGVLRNAEYVTSCHVTFHSDKITAFVLPLRRPMTPTKEVLWEYLKMHLSSAKLPDKLVLVEQMPFNNHGKIDEKQLIYFNNHGKVDEEQLISFNNHGKVDEKQLILQQSHEKQLILQQSHVSKQKCVNFESFEVAFKELWMKTLGCPLINPDDNFIVSGGNSLNAVQFTNDLELLMDCKITNLLDVLLNESYLSALQLVRKVYYAKRKLENPDNSNVKSKMAKPNIKLEKQSYHQPQGMDLHIETPQGSDLHIETPRRHDLIEGIGLQEIVKHDPEKQITTVSRRGVYGTGGSLGRGGSLGTGGSLSLIHKSSPHERDPLWRYDLGKCIDSSPTVVEFGDGSVMVMVGSHSHKFCCVDGISGALRWVVTLGDRVESSPAVSPAGTQVYVGCYDGKLYCIKVSDGTISWEYQTVDKGEVKSSPVVDWKTGCVIFGAHDKMLYCVTEKGALKWAVQISEGSVFSSPCLRDDSVYVATLDGTVARVDKEFGQILWKVNVGSPVFSSLASCSDGVIVGAVSGLVLCYSFSGIRLWEFRTKKSVFSSPFVLRLGDEEVIGIGSHDHHTHFVNGKGELIVTFAASSPVYATPFLCALNDAKGFRALICETSGTVFIVNVALEKISTQGGSNIKEGHKSISTQGGSNIKEGHKSISTQGGSNIKEGHKSISTQGGSNIKEGHKSISTQGGSNIKEGHKSSNININNSFPSLTIEWKQKLGGEIFASPVYHGGRVYVGCRDDYLYCFDLTPSPR